MSRLPWKTPLLVLLALLATAATLVTHSRARHAAQAPVPLAPALRPPPDGLARAKQAAVHAAQVEVLQSAVVLFNENEGHPPRSLTELAAAGYLRSSQAPANLRPFSYDPATLKVTAIDR